MKCDNLPGLIFPARTFIIGLVAVCALVIGIFQAQGQKVKAAPAAPTTHAMPNTNVVVLPSVVVTAAMADDPKADKAWAELVRVEKAVWGLPVGFQVKLGMEIVRPEDMGKFVDKTAVADAKNKADKAKDFYVRFPNYSKVWDARIWEYENLVRAYDFMSLWDEAETNLKSSGLLFKPQGWTYSNTNLLSRIIALENVLLENTNLSRSNQFIIREYRVERLSRGPEQDWLEAAKALQMDFPQEEEAYNYLPRLIAESSEDKGRELAKDVIASAAPEKAKARMRDILQQLDLKGKPVSLHFTALDGREVNTADMKGKVVLVAFWEPSELLELSSEKAIYEKFHAQGLEIIGVNLGDAGDKDKLTELLKKQKIPWPQYFDGKGWDNDLVRQFRIYRTPTLLLLDKQGVLREINALPAGIPMFISGVRNNVGLVNASAPPGSLEQTIKNLLAEP
jgi:hypothetical protein